MLTSGSGKSYNIPKSTKGVAFLEDVERQEEVQAEEAEEKRSVPKRKKRR